jgi:hypothetical protein
MYKEVYKVEGVQHLFEVNNENLFLFKSDNNLLSLNIRSKKENWRIASEYIDKMGFFKEYLFYNTGFSSQLISMNDGATYQKLNYKVAASFTDTGHLLGIEKNENQRMLLFTDALLNRDLWKRPLKPGGRLSIYKNILFNSQYLNDHVLNAYSLETGDHLWSFNTAPYAKWMESGAAKEGMIVGIIGVYDNTIWLALSSGSIIGLDIFDGQLKTTIGAAETEFPSHIQPEEGGRIPWGDYVQLDQDKGQLLGLGGKYFITIDLKNPIRKYIDVSKTMDAHSLQANYNQYTFPMDSDHIYFCDSQQGKIGIFDKTQAKVVWSHTLDIDKSGIAQIMNMKYVNNLWLILDRNNVLHVFDPG